MKATVTRAFKGAHDGQIKPVQIAVGDVIEGELADLAVSQGWAKALNAAPQNKAEAEAPQNRFRAAGVGGADGGDTGERAKPSGQSAKGGKGRARKG